jgi:phosphatidylglycerophosphate synthase
MPAEPVENRRPIKARAWPVFQRLARRLAERGVSPNAISTSSLVFAGAGGLALAATSWVEGDGARRALWLAGAAAIQLRLYANLLDGLVAVEGGQASATGELFNEFPDRPADAALLIGAGYAADSEPMLGALAAVAAIMTAYVRALGASLGVGQVFLGPMAKPQRMALLTVAAAWCALTPRAWHAEWFGDWGAMRAALAIVVVGGAWTIVRRLRRIAELLGAR